MDRTSKRSPVSDEDRTRYVKIIGSAYDIEDYKRRFGGAPPCGYVVGYKSGAVFEAPDILTNNGAPRGTSTRCMLTCPTPAEHEIEIRHIEGELEIVNVVFLCRDHKKVLERTPERVGGLKRER